MIVIDKLTLAFKMRLQYHNCEIYQFDKLTKKLEKIDRHNNPPDIDYWDYDKCGIVEIPYKFGKTELKIASLREIKTHFKYNYWVEVNNIRIGLLQWETHGNSCNYGYMNMLNNTLYSEDWKLYKQAIKDLKLSVSHIAKLDIAFDSVINPTKKYLKIIKDKKNEIVINGKIIKDRDKLLDTPYFIVYGTLNDPYKCPKIHLTTKDKSTTIKVYNKTEEIENNSHKYYIKANYKEKKDIYRCEVSLTTHSLNRLVNDIVEKNDLDVWEEGLILLLERIEDNNYLLQLHKDCLFRLFRYSHKGQKRKTILSYYNINH